MSAISVPFVAYFSCQKNPKVTESVVGELVGARAYIHIIKILSL